jgi:hypothetical protein
VADPLDVGVELATPSRLGAWLAMIMEDSDGSLPEPPARTVSVHLPPREE